MIKVETAEAPEVDRFRVHKGAKFLFECEITREDVLPEELQRQCVRADEMGLLRNVDIAITKRLNIVEVDRMIACCRQHPPQAMVAPMASDRAAFEDFVVYLKQRERAGVGSIGPGMLVMLIPLQTRNDYLRCQIVNTATTVGEIGAQVTSVFAPAIDQRPSDTVAQSVAMQPLPAAPTETLSDGSSVTVAVKNVAGSTSPSMEPQAEPAIGHGSGAVEDEQQNHTTEVEDGDDPFAKLRHEHAAFNAFYHHVLLEWSTKPSDTIDSSGAHELPHQL